MSALSTTPPILMTRACRCLGGGNARPFTCQSRCRHFAAGLSAGAGVAGPEPGLGSPAVWRAPLWEPEPFWSRVVPPAVS